jgi:hypothetical protein
MSSTDGQGVVEKLCKRKYWWERLSGVVALCAQWDGAVLTGEGFSWLEVVQDIGSHSQLVLKEVGCVSALLCRGDGIPRDCTTLCLPLDTQDDIAAVGISTMGMAGQTFVCGIRVFTRSWRKARELGYIRPASETIVDIHPGDNLFGVRVRVDDDAVRALKVISQTLPGRLHVSAWVGDTAGAGKPVTHQSPTFPLTQPRGPVQELPLMGKFGPGCAIVASFDVSVFVHLSPVFAVLT